MKTLDITYFKHFKESRNKDLHKVVNIFCIFVSEAPSWTAIVKEDLPIGWKSDIKEVDCVVENNKINVNLTPDEGINYDSKYTHCVLLVKFDFIPVPLTMCSFELTNLLDLGGTNNIVIPTSNVPYEFSVKSLSQATKHLLGSHEEDNLDSLSEVMSFDQEPDYRETEYSPTSRKILK